MSRYFVTDAPVELWEFDPEAVASDVPPNVIVIRAKMDVGTRGKVQSELFSLGSDGTVAARLGENLTALLIHNIVAWRGPDFDGVPCDAAHIRTLDPTEPHVARVIEEITRRNAPAPSPKAASVASNGSSSAGDPRSNGRTAGGSSALVTSTSTSALRSGSAGRRSR